MYKDPEKRRQYARDYHSKNYRADPQKYINRVRRSFVKTVYGLSKNDFDALLLNQDGKCAVCKNESPGGHGQWHIDHDHKTQRVRGLLCVNCNCNKVGMNDLESAKAVLAYLLKYEVEGV
jgi:hypothetical protein